VSSRSTELEVMVWTAEATKDRVKNPQEFEELMKAVALSGPQCHLYIRSVGELALQIGGGSQSPTLFFMDRFSKLYGENKSLGEEFITTLCTWSPSKIDKCIYFKVALITTNLVSDKVVDNISKLIVKTDIDRLKGAEKKKEAVHADNLIKIAWEIGDSALERGGISQDDFDEIVGQTMVRLVLITCCKQNHGPENVIFKSTEEIKQVFIKDIKKNVAMSSWTCLMGGPPQMYL
jgi:hypothetical protein